MSLLADPLHGLAGLAPASHFGGAPSLPLPTLTGVKGSQSCQSQVKEGYSSQQDKKATGHQEVAPALLARCPLPHSPAKLPRPGPLTWTHCLGELAPWGSAHSAESNQPHPKYLCPTCPRYSVYVSVLEPCLGPVLLLRGSL